MRTIKFRAWDKKTKRFIQNDTDNLNRPNAWIGQYAIDSDGKLFFFESTEGGMDVNEIQDVDICLFTGLHDKKNTELYDGDLIEEQTIRRVFQIKWNEQEARFVLMFLYGENGDYGQFRHIVDVKNMKKIGNIYENPELITNSKTL